MDKKPVYTVGVDFDKMAAELLNTPATSALSETVRLLLITTVAISSLHFIDEENDNLAIAAAQVNALSDKVLRQAGLNKEQRGAIYDAVDAVYADVYTAAVEDLERALAAPKPTESMEN